MNPPSISPLDPAQIQAVQDAEHLRLLSIFYYVFAGFTALTGLLFLFHIFMGLAIVGGTLGPPAGVQLSPDNFPSAPSNLLSPEGQSNAPPSSFGWLFVGVGAFALLSSELFAFLAFLAGRNLAARKGKTLIQVVAALACLHVPFGTVLGVFTFIVLSRPSVAARF